MFETGVKSQKFLICKINNRQQLFMWLAFDSSVFSFLIDLISQATLIIVRRETKSSLSKKFETPNWQRLKDGLQNDW